MQRQFPAGSFKLIALLAIIQIILTSFNLITPVIPYDEGITNYYAQRILYGDLPYQDFWALYAPGQFYWLAALFKIFGVSLLVSRVSDMIFRVLLTTMLYLVASKIASPKTALVTWALAVIWIMPDIFFGYVAIPALLLCVVSIYCLILYFYDSRSRYLVLSGLFAGLSILFRQDFIFYLLAAEGSTLFLFTILQHDTVRQKLTHFARHGTRFGIGLLSILGLYALIVFFYFSPADLFDQLYVFTLTIHRDVRWLPFPVLDFSNPNDLVYEWIPTYLPIVIYVLMIGRTTWLLFRRRNRLPMLISILLVGLFGAILYAQVVSRNDFPHRLPTYLLLMALLPVFLSERVRLTRHTAQIFFAILLVLTLISPVVTYFTHAVHALRPGCKSDYERSSCLLLTEGQDEAVEFIINNTSEDDYVFVGLPRHDRIIAYDNILLFIANRRSPTKYQEIHPGVADTVPIQKVIVQSLIERQVRYIVLTSRFDYLHLKELNATSVSSGAVYLDDFIRANYQQIEQFETYQIWERSTDEPILPSETA